MGFCLFLSRYSPCQAWVTAFFSYNHLKKIIIWLHLYINICFYYSISKCLILKPYPDKTEFRQKFPTEDTEKKHGEHRGFKDNNK